MKMNKTLGSLLAISACMGGLSALQLPRLRLLLGEDKVDLAALQAAESLQRDRLGLLKTMPTFGFDNLVADWIFLNFLQYFGNGAARQITGYQNLPDFFQVIVRRDPYFRLSYQFMSSTVTLFAGEPQQTVALLAEGLSHMKPTFPPDSYWLWRYKAVDELLFLGDTEAAIASLEQNVAWASQSPDPNGAENAQRAERLANFLRQNPENLEVRANSWMMIWGNAVNEDIRQYAQSHIEALGFQVFREGNSIRIAPATNPDSSPSGVGEG
jgi:hypothetical protein